MASSVIFKGAVSNRIHYEYLDDEHWKDGFLILGNNPQQDAPAPSGANEFNVMLKKLPSIIEEQWNFGKQWNHSNFVSVLDFSWQTGLCAIQGPLKKLECVVDDSPGAFWRDGIVNEPFKEYIRQMVMATSHLHNMGRVFNGLSLDSVFCAGDSKGHGVMVKMDYLKSIPIKDVGTERTLKLKDWKDLGLVLERIQSFDPADFDPELEELCTFLKENNDLENVKSRILEHMLFWKGKKRDFLDRFEKFCEENIHNSKFRIDLDKMKGDIMPSSNWTELVDVDLLAHLNSQRWDQNTSYNGKNVVDWLRFCCHATIHCRNIPMNVKQQYGLVNRNRTLHYLKSLQPKMLLTMKKLVEDEVIFWRYFEGGDERI